MKGTATSLKPEIREEDEEEQIKEEAKAEVAVAEIKPEEPPIFSLPTPNGGNL